MVDSLKKYELRQMGKLRTSNDCYTNGMSKKIFSSIKTIALCLGRRIFVSYAKRDYYYKYSSLHFISYILYPNEEPI